MIKRPRFPKIFFGWWIVVATGILSMWGYGYSLVGFSALFKPLATELGLSRVATSVVGTLGRIGGGLEAPVTGWLSDRYGPRVVILLGVSILSLGLILMNFINSLWSFFVVWGIIVSIGGQITLGPPLEKGIANWFVRKRGLAISIRFIFTAYLVLPLITWLITTQGWRMTCVIGGVVMLAIGLPLAWFVIRPERPEHYGLLPDGATVKEELKQDTSRVIDRGIEYATEVGEIEFTVRQAMRTPAYWFLVSAQIIGPGMAIGTMVMHVIPLLTDMGISPTKASTMVMIAALISIVARVIAGALGDRVKLRNLSLLYGGAILLLAVGIGIFLLNQTLAMVYPFLIVFWIGYGAVITLMSIVSARYFGRKAFGSIRGSIAMLSMPFGILGPIYTGWVYDTTGSYITAFTLIAALLVFSAIIMFFIPPPKPPAVVTDIHKIM